MSLTETYREEIYHFKRYGIRFLILAGFLILINEIVDTVPAGHVGVIYNNLRGGIQLEEYNGGNEGMGFKVPLINFITFIPTTTQKQNIQLTPKDKTGLSFQASFNINYHINPDQAAEILKFKGKNYQDTIFSGMSSEGIQLFSQYPQQNITSQSSHFGEILKDRVQKRINDETTSPLKQGYIIIESINLVSIHYTPYIDSNLMNEENRKESIAQQRYDLEMVELAKNKSETEARATAMLEKIKVDASNYAIQQEALTKAEAIKKIAEAYRNVPPSYILAKAYESIQPTDKIIIGIDSITNPNQMGIIGNLVKPILPELPKDAEITIE